VTENTYAPDQIHDMKEPRPDTEEKGNGEPVTDTRYLHDMRENTTRGKNKKREREGRGIETRDL